MKIYFKPWWIVSIGILFLCFWFAFLKFIAPGYVGIKINLLGEKKGVDPHTIGTGIHWIPPWKKVYKFPTFMQNHTWEGDKNSFSFQTSEGLYVNAEIGISYHIIPEKIHVLFQQYRRGLDEITHVFLKNYLRDAINKTASTMKIEDLYSTEKKDFFECIEKQLSSKLESQGIHLDRIYLIGRFHLPQSVVNALNMRIEAIQKAHQRENELKESEAFARKQIALAKGEAEARLITSDAESKSNTMLINSITSDLILMRAIEKWNGELPQTVASELSGILKEIGR